MKYGKMNNETSFDDICANCGGRRGLHNNMNQRCPMNINASPDHTEYRKSVFKDIEVDSPVQILIDALRDIDLYDDVADPPFTPEQFGDIARKALAQYNASLPGSQGEKDIINMNGYKTPKDCSSGYYCNHPKCYCSLSEEDRKKLLAQSGEPDTRQEEVICVFCEMPCEAAPTKRGWSSVRHGKGLHFDCAGKVVDQGNAIGMKELEDLGKDPLS